MVGRAYNRSEDIVEGTDIARLYSGRYRYCLTCLQDVVNIYYEQTLCQNLKRETPSLVT